MPNENPPRYGPLVQVNFRCNTDLVSFAKSQPQGLAPFIRSLLEEAYKRAIPAPKKMPVYR